MDLYKAIYQRKSVRSYLDKDVPEPILTKILEAARMAPSASNRQEWRFVVVRDPKQREQLADAAYGQQFVAQAPVVIVCCAETTEHVMSCQQLCYPIDVAISVDHITLCATAEGLGCCWIGAFDPQRVQHILDILPEIKVVTLLPLGYPQDPSQVSKNRLPLEKIVLYETWS